MITNTFAAMIAQAEQRGISYDSHPGQPSYQYNQLMMAVSVQEQLLRSSQPSLDDEFAGCSVYGNAVVFYSLEDGIASPYTVFAGYSEDGCRVVSRYQSWELTEQGGMPADLWARVSASVWSSPE